jgi:hypothetical protein
VSRAERIRISPFLQIASRDRSPVSMCGMVATLLLHTTLQLWLCDVLCMSLAGDGKLCLCCKQDNGHGRFVQRGALR